MSPADDAVLVGEYVDEGSQAAFAELVTRYVDLVYSACARQLRDSHDAQDACQAAFIVLARKAASIRERNAVGPWLLGAARFAAKDLRARKLAARAREQAAARLRPEITAAIESANDVADVLDDALARLGDPDRALLVMRYFEGRSARESARLLGISENAAALRASRAIRRLRTAIGRCGVVVPAVGLPEFLLSHGIAPASAVVRASAAMIVSTKESVSTIHRQIARGAMMRMLKKRVAAAAQKGAMGLVIFLAGTWIVGYALAQSASSPAGMGSDIPASSTPTTTTHGNAEVVLIKSVLMENNKPVARPYVTANVGQNASVTIGDVPAAATGTTVKSDLPAHRFSISFTAGKAEGDFRPVKIEAKSTAAGASWSFASTPYFRADETMSFTLSTGKDSPEQTLYVTVKTVTPRAAAPSSTQD